MQMSNNDSSPKLKAYLAGPLFSDAERSFNEMLCRRISDFVDVYLPQRDGGLMSEMVQNGVPKHIASLRVFKCDMSAIHQADYLIAILDGRSIDEGVAFELGVAFSHSKRCIGLQTDSRRLASWGNNPMIAGALEIVFESVEDIADWLKKDVSLSLQRAIKKIAII